MYGLPKECGWPSRCYTVKETDPFTLSSYCLRDETSYTPIFSMLELCVAWGCADLEHTVPTRWVLTCGHPAVRKRQRFFVVTHPLFLFHSFPAVSLKDAAVWGRGVWYRYAIQHWAFCSLFSTLWLLGDSKLTASTERSSFWEKHQPKVAKVTKSRWSTMSF